MDISEIPKVFKLEDTIYHYTNLQSAVEHILYGKKLRLTKRKNSFDPIENIKPWFRYSQYGYPDDISRQLTKANDAKEIQKMAVKKINNAKQVCFCMNSKETISSNSNPPYPYEYFGFLKPRMWDQYGDKYMGVCLAFSLNELKESANRFSSDVVKYLTYDRLKLNHYSVDYNRIESLGINGYWIEFSKRIENVMFRKHLDYKDENEYRFLSFSENEYDYMSIENSLRAIIISENYTNDFMKGILKEYAQEWNIELLYIKWETTGLSFTTQEVKDKLSNCIKKASA